MANKLAPSIIFIDEIDGFLQSRSGIDATHTLSLKTEFMTRWDGLLTGEYHLLPLPWFSVASVEAYVVVVSMVPTQACVLASIASNVLRFYIEECPEVIEGEARTLGDLSDLRPTSVIARREGGIRVGERG